jgi:hypothetical protein
VGLQAPGIRRQGLSPCCPAVSSVPVYIQANLDKSSYVIMAEAASLALASEVTKAMNIQHCHFLSDCRQLVHFLGTQDLTNPPDWRSKPFTQRFTINATQTHSRVHNINRNLNSTADHLARQARNSTSLEFQSDCSRLSYGTICTLLQALLTVDLPDVNIITASCC